MSAVPASFWADLPLGRGVKLLEHDANGLAAFDKPAGVLSHPNAGGDEPRSLLTVRFMLEGEFFQWTPVKRRAAAEALAAQPARDSATSGVSCSWRRTRHWRREIRAQFKRKQVRKVYQALVFGAPRQPTELWKRTRSPS